MLESLKQVLWIVAPSFSLIGLGYLVRRLWTLRVDLLVALTMKVLVPAFVFHQLLTMKTDLQEVGTVFVAAWIVMLGTGLIAFGVLRALDIRARVLYLPIMFMNTVNLPFPILFSAYGPEVLPFAVGFYFASLIGVFTLGVFLISGNDGLANMFREPVIYALVLGILLRSYPVIPFPAPVLQALDVLSQITIGLILITLGMQLALVVPSQIRLSLMAAGFRFAFGLLMGLVCVWMFDMEGLMRKVVLFDSVMPSAVITSLVAQRYNAEGSLVASTVLFSTLASLVFIPVMLLVLG